MHVTAHLSLATAALALVLSACSPSADNAQSAAAETAAATPAPAHALTLEDLPAPYNEADLAAGRNAFTRCAACHTLDEGAPDRMGPNLHTVFHRKPGSKPGFRYSESMKALAASTPLETWTPEELDKWLQDPAGYLPGSAMTFNGISDPEARRDLIAWLMIDTSH
ncbi:MAG: cytochrome c family protein [Hyphomonadaceae bacterium]